MYIHSGRTIAISIHAPAKGATSYNRNDFRMVRFQSTLPRRERQKYIDCKLLSDDISIHAPAKGATIFSPAVFIVKYFNPRSREGSDRMRLHPLHTAFQFQSTLPRRERQHLLTSFRLQYGYSLFHLTNKI